MPTVSTCLKLIDQIQKTAQTLEVDTSEVSELKQLIETKELDEASLEVLETKLMQTLKEMLVIQADLTAELGKINGELDQIVKTGKNRQEEADEKVQNQAKISSIHSDLK